MKNIELETNPHINKLLKIKQIIKEGCLCIYCIKRNSRGKNRYDRGENVGRSRKTNRNWKKYRKQQWKTKNH